MWRWQWRAAPLLLPKLLLPTPLLPTPLLPTPLLPTPLLPTPLLPTPLLPTQMRQGRRRRYDVARPLGAPRRHPAALSNAQGMARSATARYEPVTGDASAQEQEGGGRVCELGKHLPSARDEGDLADLAGERLKRVLNARPQGLHVRCASELAHSQVRYEGTSCCLVSALRQYRLAAALQGLPLLQSSLWIEPRSETLLTMLEVPQALHVDRKRRQSCQRAGKQCRSGLEFTHWNKWVQKVDVRRPTVDLAVELGA